MPRRPNYGFERWRRETQKKAAREAKRLERQARPESGSGPEMGEPAGAAAPPGVWEWFSASRNRVATSAVGGRPEDGEPDDWILLTEVRAEETPPQG
jgi:hypothetical protein